MKTLSLKLTSDPFVWCFFLSLLWCVTASTPTSKTNTATITQSPTTSPTKSAAKNVSVTVTKQDETTIKGMEEKAVSGFTSPAITAETITNTEPPTTKPAPPPVDGVTVKTQNENSVTLQWKTVEGISTYTLLYNFSNFYENITGAVGDPYSHVVSGLDPGKEYAFTLFTVSGELTSTGVTFSAVTAPENAKDFKEIGQNETRITLTWEKVPGFLNYRLEYETETINIIAQEEDGTETYNVTNLESGKIYNFTLFTVFKNVNSSGISDSAPTAPRDTKSFEVVTQNETSITLKWDKVDNIQNYKLVFDKDTITVPASSTQHTVTDLTQATIYNFTLFTVFEMVQSSGRNLRAATAPRDTDDFKAATQNETSITLEWRKVAEILDYTLVYNEIPTNVTAIEGQETVTHTVLNLTSGVLHDFTLFTVFENIKSIGINLSAPTAPRDTKSFEVVTQNETSITLKWDKVDNIQNYKLVFDKVEITVPASSTQHTVTDLTQATIYNFTLFTVFEMVQSSGRNLSAPTVPLDAQGFSVRSQNETSITLQWKKVREILNYKIEFDNRSISVEETEENGILTYTIPDLASGILYSFTLFTEFQNLYSSGTKFNAATVPPILASVTVTERKTTSIVLEWKSMREDWHYALAIDGTTVPVRPKGSSTVVSHTVTSLEPGTEYPFYVTTVFMELNSTAYESFTVTTIDCTSVHWHKTDSSIEGMVQGLVSKVTATNGSDTHTSPGTNNVSFTGLYPGATYNMVFVYEKNSETFPQCSHSLTIIPPRLSASCKNWAGGYSIYIVWDRPYGMWSSVEVNVAGQNYPAGQNGEQHFELSGFQPARKYEVSIASVSGTEMSEPFVFDCKTDDRGVIAGSVMGVLLFAVLICAIVLIMLKRPDIISKKAFIRGSKQSLKNKKSQPIPVANFPCHYNQLDADENRGFSQEYENLGVVGTEQTRKAAILPENKAKNRFTNILPYDWSRVKLTSSNPNGNDDYINANYMPGYNTNREYIATQGPLPSTVNDFWRMIWEQRVKGIVMVTNCTEGGRVKCEQYWPEDKQPVCHGQVTITLSSEQQELNWTLREFRLKHRQTSEERTVKHFHFTAWPDHGVPQGTEVLVQFRGLVRRHIQAEAGGTPTVVHCSAGVGRTGTIIALDVLLQQLEKEKAVDINGFVYKMRLSRSHMVQTESQYIFLHQCIMDTLQTNDISNDNIYENADMIYVNATALRELR